MDFDQLSNILLNEITPLLEKSQALVIFAKERAKFEGWLKVELCGILSSHFPNDVKPERKRIDICCGDWGIELKTVNTNIRYKGIENKHRPITKNTQGVIVDIEKLSQSEVRNKAVLFVVFPIEYGNKNWESQLERIRSKLSDLRQSTFSFHGGIAQGIIYMGLVL